MIIPTDGLSDNSDGGVRQAMLESDLIRMASRVLRAVLIGDGGREGNQSDANAVSGWNNLCAGLTPLMP